MNAALVSILLHDTPSILSFPLHDAEVFELERVFFVEVLLEESLAVDEWCPVGIFADDRHAVRPTVPCRQPCIDIRMTIKGHTPPCPNPC